MKRMSTVDWVAWVLVVVGALNWGFVALAKLNFVQTIFGVGTALTQLIYTLVGLSGLYMLWMALGKKK